MTYEEFLTRVIDDGIAAARADYVRPDQAEKLRGSVDGFELCRGLLPSQLADALTEAEIEAETKVDASDYWYWRCRAAEIEWTCNVVSALLMNDGRPPLRSHLPTARAVIKAVEIVGVADERVARERGKVVFARMIKESLDETR